MKLQSVFSIIDHDYVGSNSIGFKRGHLTIPLGQVEAIFKYNIQPYRGKVGLVLHMKSGAQHEIQVQEEQYDNIIDLFETIN